MFGIKGFVDIRKPSPFEWASILVAFGALIVSFISYRVANNAETALQENIRLECTPVDLVISGAAIEGMWILRIYNNSRSPVNILDISHDVDTPNGSQSVTKLSYDGYDKHGAEHVETDRGFALDPARSTTVLFTESVPISKDTAGKAGVSQAKNIDDANNILKQFGIDVFGRHLNKNIDGSYSYKPNHNVFDWVNVSLTTSKNNQYNTKCYLLDDWSNVPL